MGSNASTSTIIDVTDRRRNRPVRRYYFALAATLFAGLLLYGSWLPLEFRRLSFGDAWREFSALLAAGFPPKYSRQDVAVNIVAGIPVAFLTMAALAFRSRRIVILVTTFAGTLLLSLALSLSAEFGQLWVEKRVTSLRDVACQLAGAAVGATIWAIGGRHLLHELDEFLGVHSTRSRIQILLNLYVAGFFFWSLLPFHLVTSLRELAAKLTSRELELIPFTFAYPSNSEMIFALLMDAIVYIPIGVWACAYCRRCGVAKKIAVTAMLQSVAFAIVVECAQLFVIGRFSSTTDILCGVVGAGIGIAATLAFGIRHFGETPEASNPPIQSNIGLWGAAALAYAVLLFLIFGETSGPTADPEALRRKLKTFADAPFRTLQAGGSDLRTVFNILQSIGWFLPLGILLGFSIRILNVGRTFRCVCALSAAAFVVAISLAIELSHLLSRDRHADLTDVLVRSATAITIMVIILLLKARKTGEVRTLS